MTSSNTGGNDMGHTEDRPEVHVNLSFEDVSLPPFRDILILAKKCPQGMMGVSKCMSLLAPDEFMLVVVDSPTVEAFLASKKLLNRLPEEKITALLKDKVFPHIGKGDLVRVDIQVRMAFKNVVVDMD